MKKRCTSKLHNSPRGCVLVACAHRGARFLELVRWPDGCVHLHSNARPEIVWSVTGTDGLFVGKYTPMQAFEHERQRLFPSQVVVRVYVTMDDARSQDGNEAESDGNTRESTLSHRRPDLIQTPHVSGTRARVNGRVPVRSKQLV